MSITFKAAVFSAENNQQVLEYRMFRMEEEACNFIALQDKLTELFENESVQVFWKDSEGDNISIKTEADFAFFMEEHDQESVIKLALKKSNDDQEFIWIVINGPTLHHFVVKRSEKFKSILKRYKNFTGNRNRRFKYNDQLIQGDETPLSLNMRRDTSIDVVEVRRRTIDQTTWGTVNDNAEEIASTRMRFSEEDAGRPQTTAFPFALPREVPTLRGTVANDHVITDPINASTD